MSSFIGPALPPHLQRKTDSDESNGTNKNHEGQNDSCDSVIGPSIPPELSCPAPSDLEPKPPNIGPSLPPQLCTNVPNPPVLLPHLRQAADTKEISQKSQMLLSKGSDEDDESVLILNADVSDEEDDPPDEMYGPALPPGLKVGSSKQSNRDILGPSLPPGMKLSELDDQSSEDDNIVGPLPMSEAGDSSSYIQEQLNERALRMKRKLAGEDDVDAGPMKRESWMLELPPDRAADFGLGPRQFRIRAKPELGDRSVWTDTPADRLQKKETPEEKSQEAAELEMRVIDERDKEMQQLVEKHSSKKRQESLLETHQKEIKKKKKKDKEEGKRQERRPFDRDIDLQANRFDEAQKKAIFKKAQHLNDRFSSGQSKFL